jgi:hypothetical protein
MSNKQALPCSSFFVYWLEGGKFGTTTPGAVINGGGTGGGAGGATPDT